jgi:hypothetical protein
MWYEICTRYQLQGIDEINSDVLYEINHSNSFTSDKSDSTKESNLNKNKEEKVIFDEPMDIDNITSSVNLNPSKVVKDIYKGKNKFYSDSSTITLNVESFRKGNIQISVKRNDTFMKIKQEIEHKTGISLMKSIVYTKLGSEANKEFELRKTVAEYGLKNGDTIYQYKYNP